MNSNNVPGSRSKVLVTEMARQAKAGMPQLPRFNDEGMRVVLGESKELYGELCNLMGENQLDDLPAAVRVACQVHHATIKRNKRCALAYVDQRVERLKQIRWDSGPFLEERGSHLTNSEKKFLSEYDKLLTDYSAATSVDVTADLAPPKEVLVQVRVLRDAGEIIGEESGVVNLARGTTHTLRRRDVERLVREGYLEEVQHQESV